MEEEKFLGFVVTCMRDGVAVEDRFEVESAARQCVEALKKSGAMYVSLWIARHTTAGERRFALPLEVDES